MVELQAAHLDTVFHALGDATRRQMLQELSHMDRITQLQDEIQRVSPL